MNTWYPKYDRIAGKEGLTLPGRHSSLPRPIALYGRLAFPFAQNDLPFAERTRAAEPTAVPEPKGILDCSTPGPLNEGQIFDYQSHMPGTGRCGEGFGDSVEPRDYRVGGGETATVKASDGDSAAKADTDQAEARAGSKHGFDCLS